MVCSNPLDGLCLTLYDFHHAGLDTPGFHPPPLPTSGGVSMSSTTHNSKSSDSSMTIHESWKDGKFWDFEDIFRLLHEHERCILIWLIQKTSYQTSASSGSGSGGAPSFTGLSPQSSSSLNTDAGVGGRIPIHITSPPPTPYK
jgi:hypothetical protein